MCALSNEIWKLANDYKCLATVLMVIHAHINYLEWKTSVWTFKFADNALTKTKGIFQALQIIKFALSTLVRANYERIMRLGFRQRSMDGANWIKESRIKLESNDFYWLSVIIKYCACAKITAKSQNRNFLHKHGVISFRTISAWIDKGRYGFQSWIWWKFHWCRWRGLLIEISCQKHAISTSWKDSDNVFFHLWYALINNLHLVLRFLSLFRAYVACIFETKHRAFFEGAMLFWAVTSFGFSQWILSGANSICFAV